MHYDTEYHGKGGYLSVSDGTSTPLSKNAYAPAMKEIGLPFTDCNGKSQIGTLLQNQQCKGCNAIIINSLSLTKVRKILKVERNTISENDNEICLFDQKTY